jgi:hypothetical protein
MAFYYPEYSLLIAPLYLLPIGPESINQRSSSTWK